MKKKLISTFLTVTMVAGLLAGCGSSEDKSDSDSSSGNDSVVELTFWHMEETDSRVQAFQEVVDKFNESHDGIHVNVEVQSWSDAYTKVPAAIQAGNGPDLLQSIPDFCSVIYELGVVQEVGDIITDLDDEYGFYESALTPYVYEDGGTYAVPIFGMSQVLWYRADIFEEAGLEPPTTFDELVACAEALTDKENGKYGIALPASLSMATDQVVYTLMACAGAVDVIDADNNVTFNNEGTVAAFKLYQELLQYAPTDCDTYTWGEPQALLNQGTVAMAIEKGQYLATFESESGVSAENLACVLVPTIDESTESKSIYYSNGVMLLSYDQEKKAAAKEFLMYLLSEEVYGDFLNAEPGLFLPTIEKGADYESWKNNEILVKYPEQLNTILESSSTGVLFGFTDGICMDIGSITGPNMIAQSLQQMTVNGMSPEEAVQWGQEAMEEAVAE